MVAVILAVAVYVASVVLLYLSYLDYLASRNGWKIKVPIYLGLFCLNILGTALAALRAEDAPVDASPGLGLLLMLLSAAVGLGGYLVVRQAAPLRQGEHPPKSPLPLLGGLAGALHVVLFVASLVVLRASL